VNFTDKTLKCRDCGQEFVFSAAEQELFASVGHEHDPSRCQSCRAARKERQAAAAGVRGPVRTTREMHEATCAACGAKAELPFIPRNDRPVYCRPCYAKVRAHR